MNLSYRKSNNLIVGYFESEKGFILAKFSHKLGYMPKINYVGKFKFFVWFLETYYLRLYYYSFREGDFE